MVRTSDEAQVVLALQAIRTDSTLTIRKAALIYNVSRGTLSRRIEGTQSRRDCTPNNRSLHAIEEEVIVKHILELDAQGFPVRHAYLRDMADRLLRLRDAKLTGKNWATRFIKRQPQLQTKFSRKYDYSRAQCEDPAMIRAWFDLVRNTIAKYGVDVADIFNFDETGFMMGVITPTAVVTRADRRGNPKLAQPGNREWATVIQGINSQGWAVPPFIVLAGKNHLADWYQDRTIPGNWAISLSSNGWTTNEVTLEWLQHFDRHTKARTNSKYRLLILDGHESHHSTDFEVFCKENNILTLCMPPHSSHILQPLDVACFAPLKRAYGGEIEKLMRAHITHISKADFLPAFSAAFQATFTESNIKAGFRAAGLVPLSPESVISKLDIKSSTPTPPATSSGLPVQWSPKTPHNATEATSQTDYVRNRIVRHQNSSPTSIIASVEQFAKGTQQVMHKLVLLQDEVASLREANRTPSKRRRAKKTRLRHGGTMTLENGQDIAEEKEVVREAEKVRRAESGRKKRVETRERRCGRCGNTGHNARTCQEDVDSTSESDAE